MTPDQTAEGHRDIFHPDSRALVKQHLPPALYYQLCQEKTALGFTLEQAIASGVKNRDSSIGIYAGDMESYTRFDRVLGPVIKTYHGLDQISHPHENFRPVDLPLLDPDNRFILSSRIRVARNLARFPFPPNMTAAHRLMVERQTIAAAQNLSGDLAGSYTPFSELTDRDYQVLMDQKLAFPRGDRFQEAAGINSDFPLGRGLFLAGDQGFRIWVNEEDHLRIMALSPDDDIAGVFNRLARGLEHLGRQLEFAWDPDLGFLNSCPTNIGTAMRAGVHIRLEKLEKRPAALKEIVDRHHLQIRGTGGEKTRVANAVFDISNRRRLGVSPNEILRDLHAGVKEIIHREKAL